MVAAKDVSPIRLGHAAANMGPAGASDFSDGNPKPKMRHLCKNMQKAVQGTASRLLAFIGLGGSSLTVTAPVPEGGVTRIQITTTRPATHKFAPLPVVEPVRGGPWAGAPVSYQYHHQEERFNGPFLHRAHRALMALGPWEGRIVAFVLGPFCFSFYVILAGTDDPILTLVGCGIGVLVRMFFVLTVLLVRALRGSPVPEPEDETTIFVYAEEIAPPYVTSYEVIDEKKALDVVENRA
jgi:hypothetical protein